VKTNPHLLTGENMKEEDKEDCYVIDIRNGRCQGPFCKEAAVKYAADLNEMIRRYPGLKPAFKVREPRA
jgi:hypothetical protein